MRSQRLREDANAYHTDNDQITIAMLIDSIADSIRKELERVQFSKVVVHSGSNAHE